VDSKKRQQKFTSKFFCELCRQYAFSQPVAKKNTTQISGKPFEGINPKIGASTGLMVSTRRPRSIRGIVDIKFLASWVLTRISWGK